MSFVLPETPRWLARYGFMSECKQTLADLHANGDTTDPDICGVFLEIQQATSYESRLGRVSLSVSKSLHSFSKTPYKRS
jgi:hypothetical protein